MKLDKKDMQVLAILDLDARANYASIARKVSLSLPSVKNRVRRLNESGIIRDYYLLLNAEKIGYTFFNLYLKTNFPSTASEEKAVNAFIGYPSVGWMASFNGYWSYMLAIVAKDRFDFDRICGDLNSILKRNLVDCKMTQPLRAFVCNNFFLHETKPANEPFYEITEPIQLDKEDYALLECLDENPRVSLMDISNRLEMPVSNVQHRFRRLKEKGIIKAFSISLDYSKLGYQWYHVLFRLFNCDRAKKDSFINYLRALPQVFYIIDTVGAYDLMAEIIASDLEEFKKAFDEIKNRYKLIIHSHESLIITKEYKHTYLPKKYFG